MRGKGNRKRQPAMAKRLGAKLRGRTFTPSAEPPAFSDKPWNQAVINVGGTKDQAVKISDVHTVALSQLGLLSTQTLEYRIRAVRVWALTPSRPLRVAWYGFGANDRSALATLMDWGAPQRLPRVGFQYPESVQDYTFSSAGNAVLFSVDVGSSSPTSWLAYVELLWRSDTYSPISSMVRYNLESFGDPDLVMVDDNLFQQV